MHFNVGGKISSVSTFLITLKLHLRLQILRFQNEKKILHNTYMSNTHINNNIFSKNMLSLHFRFFCFTILLTCNGLKVGLSF